MTASLLRDGAVSIAAAIAGLFAGNFLFPPEPGQDAIDALPFTLIGAVLILWPAYAFLERRIERAGLRYALLILIGFAAGGLLLGLVLALAGLSQDKVLQLGLIGASYGGLTGLFWSIFSVLVVRLPAD